MKLSCRLKILYFVIHNKAGVNYMFLQNGQHRTKVKIGKKSVCVYRYTSPHEWHCLNCDLCQNKTCAVSQIDQSKSDQRFISFLYSIMHNIHMEKNGYNK